MDKRYCEFVIGADLMHDYLFNVCELGTDEIYEYCQKVAILFFNSKYNDNMSKSDYQNLVDFIEDNMQGFLYMDKTVEIRERKKWATSDFGIEYPNYRNRKEV